MGKYKITEEMALSLDEYEYEDMIKIAAVLHIVQNQGLTEEVLEKWGVVKQNALCLCIPISKEEENRNDFFFKQTIQEVCFKISEF